MWFDDIQTIPVHLCSASALHVSTGTGMVGGMFYYSSFVKHQELSSASWSITVVIQTDITTVEQLPYGLEFFVLKTRV
jgi:uncharacterized RmlC-like cupin family protein